MSKIIIAEKPTEKRVVEGSLAKKEYLDVSELFSRTIQGEGVYSGIPAVFLRLQFCTLDCIWCDTTEVWRTGNRYLVDEILDLFEEHGVVHDLQNGHHLVLTGGSPIRQQEALELLLQRFYTRYDFLPFVEVENECTRMPSKEMLRLVNCWNNSPKLSNSGMKSKIRIKPDILETLTQTQDSWFKFVVDCEEDWEEIQQDFIDPGLIYKSRIILMPKFSKLEDLEINKRIADMAVKYGVRFSTRLQVVLWDQTTGV